MSVKEVREKEMDLVCVTDNNSPLVFRASREMVIRRQTGLLTHYAPRDVLKTALQHGYYGFVNNIADVVKVVVRVDEDEVTKIVSSIPRRHLEEELKTQLFTSVTNGKVAKIWTVEDTRQVSFVDSNLNVMTVPTAEVFCPRVIRAAMGNAGVARQERNTPMVGRDPAQHQPVQLNMRRFVDEPTADVLGTGFVRRRTVDEEQVSFNSQTTVPIMELIG